MTILLALLRRYWLHIAVVAALLSLQGYALRWAWVHGGDAARLHCAQEREKFLEAALKDMQGLEAQRDAARRKADELAKLPAKVVTVVRANPSGCVLPKPVADGLREQAAEINAAKRR